MGLYLRKSVSVGPFRFNLSSSGLGISAGVRGLRVGSGPRGNYIHMGRNGLYYRATLPSNRGQGFGDEPVDSPQIIQGRYPQQHAAPLQQIETVSSLALAASSEDELLGEIKAKDRITRMGPIAVWGGLALLVLAYFASMPTWLHWGIGGAALPIIVLAFRRDKQEKTTVILYHLDEEMAQAFSNLTECAKRMSKCNNIWSIASKGNVYTPKYHGGASTLLDRKPARINFKAPMFIQSNADPFSIHLHNRVLWFYPDRILVSDSAGISSMQYLDLELSIGETRFIESSGAPRDAKVVGQTWRFTNKNGGPDRRFNNNHQIPICLYEELHFKCKTGLVGLMHLSKLSQTQDFKVACFVLASCIEILKVLPIVERLEAQCQGDGTT